MTVSLEHGLLILALALVTYLTRVSGFFLGSRRAPQIVTRALHYVPIAAFAALIVPGLAAPGELAPRLIAALCTGVVALRSGALWAALLVGMTVYWGVRALSGG
ncbi:MAG: AzlD domain-containing protein [Thermomicrobiales bacterium]